jgi:hypothetical protein
MTLSVLLTTAWDSKTEDAPRRLEVPKVRPHRFSWKNAGTVGFPKSPWTVVPQRWVEGDDRGSSEDAEIITSAGDESIFTNLHGVLAKDTNYDELAERIAGDEYDGLLDVLKEMAAQQPDVMWFVKSWIVETGVPE